jgi:uncharacterized membrane protein
MKTRMLYTLFLALGAYFPQKHINNYNIYFIFIPRNSTPQNKEFRAFGTGLFWSVNVSHTGIVYSLYPYSALFIQGHMVLEGCAEKSS